MQNKVLNIMLLIVKIYTNVLNNTIHEISAQAVISSIVIFFQVFRLGLAQACSILSTASRVLLPFISSLIPFSSDSVFASASGLRGAVLSCSKCFSPVLFSFLGGWRDFGILLEGFGKGVGTFEGRDFTGAKERLDELTEVGW